MDQSLLTSNAIMGLYFARLESDPGMAWIDGVANLFTSDQASSGIQLVLGGNIAGASYATVCISAQTGTVDVEAYTLPPERVAP